MDNKSHEFSLTEGQKSRLFGLGLAKPHDRSVDTDERKTDLLYDVLSSRLPVDLSIIDSLPDVVTDLCPNLNSVAGDTIGDLLQNPQTRITSLKRIKAYTKESGISAESEAQSDVYLVVYYGAIASALLSHGKKITKNPFEDLKAFFLSFSQEAWVLEEVKDLFRQAHLRCERITDTLDSPKE